jgi:hypothetical protein
MMRPLETDFAVTCDDGGAAVTFTPTNSHYSFTPLVEQNDIERFGAFSPDVWTRHGGPTGDTGGYPADEVATMARLVAERAWRSR